MTAYRLAVDIGGTFTDVVLQKPDSSLVTTKTLTTPDDPVLGAMAGIDQVLGEAKIGFSELSMLIHGTTLATNTLIEKKGARVGALLTEGFRDILEIGYERRYRQDDLFIDKPDLLVPRERCVTVSERVSAKGEVLLPVDPVSLKTSLDKLIAENVDSVAVCFLHAYANSAHEDFVAHYLAQHYPQISVTLSSGVAPEIREFDRLCTAISNAYVKPQMSSYLTRFENSLCEKGFSGIFYMMTSSGGMTTLDTARRYPIRLVESGPAGGAILAAKIATQCELDQVVSFDMGGTTAKFSMIDDGRPLTTRHFEIARAERFTKGSGIPARIPTVEMIEIGAGGGSVASVDQLGRINIGPRSMGSEPGPACFSRGGTEATVTDADVVLGRIHSESFAQGAFQVDSQAAENAMTQQVAKDLQLSASEAAHGVVRMVSENMANAGRVHAAERGASLSNRVLIALGGNGPLHAAEVAQRMGIENIVIPADPGVGSAVGFLYAPISYELIASHYTTLENFDFETINNLINEQLRQVQCIVGGQLEELRETRIAFMRYAGQGHEIEVQLPNRDLHDEDLQLLINEYNATYKTQFKRIVPGMRIEILNWTVRVEREVHQQQQCSTSSQQPDPLPAFFQYVFLDESQAVEVPVYNRSELSTGHNLKGPCLILESQTTTLVPKGYQCNIDQWSNIRLNRLQEQQALNRQLSAIDYQLMWNRLLAVVEEQGQALIRSAFSPIVRECGDISAGVFDSEGQMLAQAVTGTPGHINTMAESVANFLQVFPLHVMCEGDIFVTNDPWLAAGHLNDYMLVKPVFYQGVVVGFTACTSHLVDVGGLCMGPNGSDIYDEGVRIPPCRLVSKGEINKLLIEIICANSRHPVENEGDLYALIACCEVGEERLHTLMQQYLIDDLIKLSEHIIDSSYVASIEAFKNLPRGEFSHSMRIDGYDFEIDLKACIKIADNELVLDFSGSSECSSFGINVPLNYAAAYSVFAIRCVLGAGIPNNAGSLRPFRVTAPPGCIVNALHPAPVAMRHTIGQLLPDVVFGCMEQFLPDLVPAEGASCMYDLPMRSLPSSEATHFAVELVHNGGTGARPNKDGLSATAYPSGVWGSQVEITECTVPLRVLKRELRPDSGGVGFYRGGLGQIIEVESASDEDFLLFLSLDRVKYPARGRREGGSGATGRASVNNGVELPGRGEVTIKRGSRLIFETPGGGGIGNPKQRALESVQDDFLKGLISSQAALDKYAVVIDSDGILDCNATAQIRRSEL
ncbi:MAG: 5-oxoprolinase (ATP-hydrolyzing) [Gammaproteobacteria bacterium]|jgi:5-oxoprolinase (ATP-hydrolysing)